MYACSSDTLAFSKFHLSQPMRSEEAQSMEHPVLSNCAKVPHQGFVLILRDQSDHFVGSALNNNRVNTYMAEEAQDISDKVGW